MMQDLHDRRRNRVLIVLFVGVLMGALDIAIVGPALPAIQRHFGVDDRHLAWMFSIYVLFFLVGTPLMAKLSDRFGRRAIYVLDVVLFSLGSLIVALSPSFAIMLIGRAVQGFGSGGIFPVASAVIGDTFPAERRGRALGLIGAVFGLAFLLGPVLGGILLRFGWMWLFLINLPIALFVIAASLRLLPATRPAHPLPLDWPGTVVLTMLLASLAYGINQLDMVSFLASLTSTRVWPFLLLALALLPLFWHIERHARDPLIRLGLYASRQMMLVTALASGAGLSEASVAFIPQLSVAAFGVDASTASFMLLPLVAAVAVGSPIVGRLLDGYGSRVLVLMGTLLLAAGMTGLSFLAASRLPLFYLSSILIGLGIASLVGAPLRYIALAEAPPAERATAQGSINLFIGVGRLVGGTMIGAVAGSYGGGAAGYTAAYLVGGAVALLLAILASQLKGRAQEMALVTGNETGSPARSTLPTGSQ
jgi:EmrB/QacA subfamily drug resistance transporter